MAILQLCNSNVSENITTSAKLDKYLPQSNGQSAIQQFLVQLAYVLPTNSKDNPLLIHVREGCQNLASQVFEMVVTLERLAVTVPIRHALEGRLQWIDPEDIPELYHSKFERDVSPCNAPRIEGVPGYYAHDWHRWLGR